MKQKKFVFCRYSFKEDPDSKEEKRVEKEKVQEQFGKLFQTAGKFQIYMKKGKEEVCLQNNVIAEHDNIIVFRLNDDKDIKITLPTGTTTNNIDDYKEKTESSYPYCHIIFLNLGDVKYMAIEKNYSTFNGNIDRILKILTANFNRLIKEYGYTIEFEKILMRAKAWSLIKRRCISNNDYVTQICLTAKRDGETAKFANFSSDNDINGLIKRGEENEAKEVFFGSKYAKGTNELSIKNAIDTMFNVAEFVSKNDCEIRVKMSKSGMICLNDEVVPMYFMPDLAIENFQMKSSLSIEKGDYELLKWLNECIDDIKKTENETTPPAKISCPN